jgi:hypothetical protein
MNSRNLSIDGPQRDCLISKMTFMNDAKFFRYDIQGIK